jgi:hypothetical protein
MVKKDTILIIEGVDEKGNPIPSEAHIFKGCETNEEIEAKIAKENEGKPEEEQSDLETEDAVLSLVVENADSCTDIAGSIEDFEIIRHE